MWSPMMTHLPFIQVRSDGGYSVEEDSCEVFFFFFNQVYVTMRTLCMQKTIVTVEP